MVPATPKKRSKLPFILAGLVVLLFACCGFFGLAAYLGGKDQQTFAPLAAACSGQAVPGAPAYLPGRPHRGAVFEASATPGTYTWSGTTMLPVPQQGTAVADTDVVICLGAARTVALETCTYRDTVVGVGVPGSESSLARTSTVRDARAVAAATGATLLSDMVAGPAPHDCDTTFGHAPTASDLTGDAPGATELGQWLASKVP